MEHAELVERQATLFFDAGPPPLQYGSREEGELNALTIFRHAPQLDISLMPTQDVEVAAYARAEIVIVLDIGQRLLRHPLRESEEVAAAFLSQQATLLGKGKPRSPPVLIAAFRREKRPVDQRGNHMPKRTRFQHEEVRELIESEGLLSLPKALQSFQ